MPLLARITEGRRERLTLEVIRIASAEMFNESRSKAESMMPRKQDSVAKID